jgi:hypothetical protein
MERALLNNIRLQLDTILSRIPGISVRQPTRTSARDCGVDLLLDVRYDGGKTTLAVEVKSSGQPGLIRGAAQQLRRLTDSNSRAYPVLGMPYLTARGIGTCREEGIGCIDAAGNCLLSFGNIYIEVRGNLNAKPARREIKSLFSPKSSRVARVLLSDVGRWWGVREIAAEAKINPGLVSRLKKQLVVNELAVEEKGSMKAESRPLLNAFVDNYSYRRNEAAEFYSLDPPADAEQALVTYCRANTIRCALALFSGAARVAPHVRMNKSFAFVEGDLDSIAEGLGWKRVTSGANVMLLAPYDAGVFLFDREIDGLPVVSDVQLYLDLKTYRGRGEEAAGFLFEHCIQPEWQRKENTNRSK